MINITLVEDIVQMIKMYPRYLDYTHTVNIENDFKRIVEWNRDAFRDEMSLKIMKEIDNAVREGVYEVCTPIGESCITCLSTGCKLALLLWFYHDIDVAILTKISQAGSNVWKFASENFDAHIFLKEEDMGDFYRFGKGFTVDGVFYNEDNYFDLLDICSKRRDKIYTITKEKECKAYEEFCSHSLETIRRDLKEEVSLKDLIKGIEEEFGIENHELDYQVVNYCPILPNDFVYRKLPIWYVGRKGKEYRYFNDISVKYPTFSELLIYNIVQGYNWSDDTQKMYFSNEYDEFFALVLHEADRCKISEYPELSVFGVLVNTKEKIVTIFDKQQAVHKFHEWYGKVEEA